MSMERPIQMAKENDMAMSSCPQCNHEIAAGAMSCSACGRLLNGTAPAEAGGTTQQSTRPLAQVSGKLPPELMEWARQQFNEEEFLAGLREIQETGGLELKDFIQDLEQEATSRD
jgi:hypothetical protein